MKLNNGGAMKLTVNGAVAEYEVQNFSVTDLIARNKVESPDMVSVQLNGDFLERAQYTSTLLKDGDEIDFLYFMGGGRS